MNKIVNKNSEIIKCVKNHKRKEVLNIHLANEIIGLLQCDEYDANDEICEQCRIETIKQNMNKEIYQ
ncbi:MAG: hypothetical protein U0L17_00975 [Acutalibacteraceae bacterium]|nr:hypothetical protein [Acutalibacteraceae bacterium]